jgi:hypothetical protein
MHGTWHAGRAVQSLRQRARRGSAAKDINPYRWKNEWTLGWMAREPRQHPKARPTPSFI